MGNRALLKEIDQERTNVTNKIAQRNPKFLIALLGTPRAGKTCGSNTFGVMMNNNSNHWSGNTGRIQNSTTKYFTLRSCQADDLVQFYDSPGVNLLGQVNVKHIFDAFEQGVPDGASLDELVQNRIQFNNQLIPDAYLIIINVNTLYQMQKSVFSTTYTLIPNVSNALRDLYNYIQAQTKRDPYFIFTHADEMPGITPQKIKVDTDIPLECIQVCQLYTEAKQPRRFEMEKQLWEFLYRVIINDN